MLFSIFTFTTYAQCRLGSTKSEIIKEFADLTAQEDVADDGTPFITYELYDFHICYYFLNDVCMRTVISPHNYNVASNFIKKYNNSYIRMSETLWMWDTGNNIISISLDYADGLYFFIFDYKS